MASAERVVAFMAALFCIAVAGAAPELWAIFKQWRKK